MAAPDLDVIVTLDAVTFDRLDKALAAAAPEELGLSRTRIGKLIATGKVSRGGVVVKSPKETPAIGDYMVAMPAPEPLDAQPQDIPLDIVYEDEALLVVNKAAGMVVHPAPGTPDGTLVNAILYHCQDALSGIGGALRPGIVHRIDKDTSGLLVVAKSDVAHQGLSDQFRDHSIHRKYLALCIGAPDRADPRVRGLRGVRFEEDGTMRIATNLARHKTDRKRQAVSQNEGRHAITKVATVARTADGRASLVECHLETGRTHQIRVHLSHIGHGLIGDPVYGHARKVQTEGLSPDGVAFIKAFDRQALHAAELGFVHPVSGDVMQFSAEMPQDMKNLVNHLQIIESL